MVASADSFWLWLGGLWLSAFTSATLLPGTSEAALLAMHSAYPQQIAWIWAVAVCGNSLGSMVSYVMGRCLPVRRKSSRAEMWLQKHGAWLLLLAWVPIVGDGLPVAAGWLRLPWLWCALMLTVGKALRYAVLLVLASAWL